MQTKATNTKFPRHNPKHPPNNSGDWHGPCVFTTLEIVTYTHDSLPVGQEGCSLGQHVDNMLIAAWDNGQTVGKITLDCTDLPQPQHGKKD